MNYADLFRVTLPETVLEAAALVVLLVDLGLLRGAAQQVRRAVAALVGVAGCGAAYGALQFEGRAGLSFDGSTLLAAGGFAQVAQSGILLLTALTLLLVIDSDLRRHAGEYVAVLLMAASGGLLIAAAQDLLVIFIGLELLSLGLYILTAFAKNSGKSAEAALKYYLFGGMSAAFLLFGFSYFYGLGGTTSIAGIELAISRSGPSPLLYVAWILVVAGLGFKVAAVPFHLWAPDAYEGAPAPAAAFIASVSKVASFALLVTLSLNWLMPGVSLAGAGSALEQLARQYSQTWPRLATILLVVATASILWGNLAALVQVSVRRLLAYSAIAHAGYILLGIATVRAYTGEGSALAFYAAAAAPAARSAGAVLYYVLTYGLTTIGAFGVVAVVEQATGSDRMDAFMGLHKRNPLLAAILLVLFLSLAGIPPLVGFWAKFNLFAAVLGVSAGVVPFALVALAVAMSAVSLYYYLQVLKRAYVMAAVEETPLVARPVSLAVLLAIAAAVLLLGCFPALLQNWIGSFVPTL
ncbi:MAG: NADH-quinone oxidoreductase subunit N [Terracidiphilus sp.]